MGQKTLTAKQIYERRNLPFVFYVLRPLGRRCLPIAAYLGLTPNQVTLFSILLTGVALTCLAIGGVWFSLAGIGTLNLALILDMVDGDLARLTGRTSKSGEFLDSFGGAFRQSLQLPALGIGLARSPDLGYELLVQRFDFVATAYAHLGIWAGFLYLWSRLTSLRFRVTLGAPLRGESGVLSRVSLNIEDVLIPLLVIGALTRSLSLVLIMYACYYVVVGLYTGVGAIGRAVVSDERGGAD